MRHVRLLAVALPLLAAVTVLAVFFWGSSPWRAGASDFETGTLQMTVYWNGAPANPGWLAGSDRVVMRLVPRQVGALWGRSLRQRHSEQRPARVLAPVPGAVARATVKAPTAARPPSRRGRNARIMGSSGR
jgi:hypothetical protein